MMNSCLNRPDGNVDVSRYGDGSSSDNNDVVKDGSGSNGDNML